MSESKYTPGPWYWNRNAGGPLEVCSEQGVHRCVARAHLCEADARLIAAAPRLLEAARFAQERVTRILTIGSVVKQAGLAQDIADTLRAAIAEAAEDA